MEFSTRINAFRVEQLGDEQSSGNQLRSFGSEEPRPMRRPLPQSDPRTDALPDALAINWTKLKQSGFSPKFYSRLLRLASDRFNMSLPASTERIRPSSLTDFLDFWMRVKDEAVEPEISVSNDGSVFVEWFKSNTQRLDIKFGESGVFFGLFDNGNILEGAQRKETVATILQNHSARPLRWHA